MESIKIEIETVNAAFEDRDELPRILRTLANRLEDGDCPELLRDINGATVGRVTYE